MTFEEARRQFPVLERYAYLNAGTNGPLASATVDALVEETRRDLSEGRSGKQYLERMLGLRGRLGRGSPTSSASTRCMSRSWSRRAAAARQCSRASV